MYQHMYKMFHPDLYLSQPLSLGLLRSDYFLDVDTDGNRKTGVAKQVEVNTIAASYGGLSPILQKQQK